MFFFFVIGTIVLVTIGLTIWHLREYARAGALHPEVGSEIPIEKEKFIPLLRNALHRALVKLIGESEDDLSKLSELLELIIKLENRALLSELIKDFEVFDPTYAALQHTQFTDEERDAAEHRFLENFMAMMEKANYKILSRDELEFAESEQYLLHIPVATEWEKIDNKMLGNFFKTPDGQKFASNDDADISKQVIIWRRGVGIDRTTGMLLWEKIDSILTRWFDAFAKKVVYSEYWTKLTGDVVQKPRPAVNQPYGANVETVQRINLKDMSLSWDLLSKPVTIQEPTFKEVVAMFRFTDKNSDKHKPDSTIHIKAFHDIPLGDMDIIFPAKKILFKTYDFLRLGITGVIGLFFALYAFGTFASGESISTTLMTATFGFLAYASRTYWAIQWSVDTYRTVLSDTLYKKSSDSHLGVILFLMEALESQEWKEALISYCIALKAGGKIAETDLDTKAEEFIKTQMDAAAPKVAEGEVPIKMPSVDFEVDDALDKLQRLGLATLAGTAGARIVDVVPLEQAIKTATKHLESILH